MAIDLQNEDLLTLAEAALAVPRVNGRKPHISTMWRWCRKGLRGVQLEHVRVTRICTSREALNRFFERLADADTRPAPVPPGPTLQARTAGQRDRDVRRAEQTLRAAGI